MFHRTHHLHQPLHFACAYGAIEEVVEMLIAEDSNTILAQNNDNRTPLHFLMGNCDRHRSHSILDILLKTRPEVVNYVDKSGKLAIELLGIRAKDIDPNNEEARRNAMKCLTIYLNAKPDGCTELFTALQGLPNWLLDSAVVLPAVQKILNTKISEVCHSIFYFYFYFLPPPIQFILIDSSFMLLFRYP